eukprot:4793847-Pyramimonas_sp.AAC.1
MAAAGSVVFAHSTESPRAWLPPPPSTPSRIWPPSQASSPSSSSPSLSYLFSYPCVSDVHIIIIISMSRVIITGS